VHARPISKRLTETLTDSLMDIQNELRSGDTQTKYPLQASIDIRKCTLFVKNWHFYTSNNMSQELLA